MVARSFWPFALVLGMITTLLAYCQPRHIDDAYRYGNFMRRLVPGTFAPIKPDGIAIFLVEKERRHGNRLTYIGRVVVPIRGLALNQRIAFADRDRENQLYEQIPAHSELAPRAYPMMAVGREYLVLVKVATGAELQLALELSTPGVERLGLPIARLLSCVTIRADLRDIRPIVPQLRRLAEILQLPWEERRGPLRDFLFENLDTRHAFLRHIVTEELASNLEVYSDHGMTLEQATRLALWSQAVVYRFSIMQKLARFTPLNMDHWFFRVVSKDAPGRLRPGDAAGLAAFDDALQKSAKNLSIDTFWPIIERHTRPMSIWVSAFAQQGDPRLLPVIMRHLQPGKAEHYAVEALAHYKGRPEAARALIEHLRKTNDLGDDKRAQRLAQQALKAVGTPDAVQEAERLRQVKKLD